MGLPGLSESPAHRDVYVGGGQGGILEIVSVPQIPPGSGGRAAGHSHTASCPHQGPGVHALCPVETRSPGTRVGWRREPRTGARAGAPTCAVRCSQGPGGGCCQRPAWAAGRGTAGGIGGGDGVGLYSSVIRTARAPADWRILGRAGKGYQISGWQGSPNGKWGKPGGGGCLFRVNTLWLETAHKPGRGKPRPQREVMLRVPRSTGSCREKSLRRGWTGRGCGRAPGSGRGPRLGTVLGEPPGVLQQRDLPTHALHAPPPHTHTLENVHNLVSPPEPLRLTLGASPREVAVLRHPTGAVFPQAPGQEGGLSRVWR